MKKKKYLVFGYHATMSKLKNKKNQILSVYFSKKNNKVNQVIKISKSNNIKIKKIKEKEIKKKNKSKIYHQNLMTKIFKYKNKETLKIKNKLCLIMDGIKSSNNLGKIIRLSLAFNVSFIIVKKKRCITINQKIEKSSSGAISLMAIIEIKNMNTTLKILKKKKYTLVSSTCNNGVYPWNYCFRKKKIALIIGSEHSGSRELARKNCDSMIKIPINKKINSINTANATGIILYEIYKQKKTRR